MSVDRHGELLVFARVVDEGNFSAAARSLSLSPSTVSKLVTRLESRFGATLFRRSGREVTLTAEGKVFHAAALKAIEALEATEAAVSSSRLAPDMLRIRSMPSFATAQLAPLVPAFCRLHPTLKLEILLSMQPGNLLDGGVDVAIHVGPLADSSLIVHRFAWTRWIICAAPAYLANHGKPETAGALAQHECLNFLPGIPAPPWAIHDGSGGARRARVEGRILSNQAQMLLELARGGAGIVQLTEYQIADDLRSGRLVALFADQRATDPDPIYAVYASKKNVSSRIRVFLEFIDVNFARDKVDW